VAAAAKSGASRRRPGFSLAYNTNGLAHHRLDDAIDLLKRLGYRGVAVTVDAPHLDPRTTSSRELARVRRRLEAADLSVAVETGARYLLDPFRKHQPTLLSRRGWRRREEFLLACLETARRLGARVVSLWSGTPDYPLGFRAGLERLAERCRRLADEARARGLVLGFEPEPGMLIDSLSRYRRLRDRVDHPAFGLTLDLGHVHCRGEGPVADRIEEFAADLRHVHAEDMVRGVHEHLPFGRGEMDYRPILRKLAEVGYRGMVAVELSRDSHRAVEAAEEAIAFFRRHGAA
jgi:L-ribulose-5-phosphate 3-epimerase